MIIFDRKILLTDELRVSINALGESYLEHGGKDLVCTSALRTPYRQAEAMYENYKYNRGVQYQKVAAELEIRQVWYQYFHSPNTPKDTTVLAMIKVIEKQIERGEYISPHLVANAADFGLDGLVVSAFDAAVSFVGAWRMAEPHCMHVTFHRTT